MDLPAVSIPEQFSAAAAVGETLLEIANMELDFAVGQLAGFAADPEQSVHQCRRAIKRLRALVRIGIAVAGAQPRPLDRQLRNAARVLAPIRDASEARRTLGRVLDAHPDLESLKHLEILSDDAIDTDISIEKALRRLNKARAMFPEFFADRDAWSFVAVATGIEASYVRSATELYRFSGRHSDKIGHQWRKEVQRLTNQLNIIRPLSPDFLSGTINQLAALSDLLGEHNDLSVLRSRLRARRSKLPKKTHATLREIVRTDQRRLREQAIELGHEIFGMSPDEFRSQLLDECADSVV